MVFDHTFNIDKITHTPNSNIANTFTIYFKDLEAKNGKSLGQVCSDYSFIVEDTNQKINSTRCLVKESKKAFKLDFKITKHPYNIENATVSVCRQDECKKIEDIEDFSVYGTDFDVTQDGFSFKNGGWNRLALYNNPLCWKLDFCFGVDDHLTAMIKLFKAFKEFMPDSKKEKAIDLIGYYNLSGEPVAGAVCHGMAVSAIANFNNFNANTAAWWGSDLVASKTKDEIVSIFQSHWDNRNRDSAKPFSKTVHSYNVPTDAFHSLGKIGYYYLSQEGYTGQGALAWVGQSKMKKFSGVEEMNKYYQSHLNNNVVSIFGFDLKRKGIRAAGHTVIAVELIKYNDKSIIVLHDNNFIDELVMLAFESPFERSSFELSSFVVEENNTSKPYTSFGDLIESNEKTQRRYSSYDAYSGFMTYTDGELGVYGKNAVRSQHRAFSVSDKSLIDYPYSEHLSVKVLGGKLLKVIDSQTQQEIVLRPVVDDLQKEKAYLLDNVIVTGFVLPRSGLYKVELQKYQQYPAFEVYVKIPTEDGRVEVINYEDLATNPIDQTTAYFYVGNGNNDKTMKREGEDDVAPTYDEFHDTEIIPAKFLKVIILRDGVKLSWNLPESYNLKDVVVIRKEGSPPVSINDGTEIYRGLDESYTDLLAQSNSKYYYALYTTAKNGSVVGSDVIYVDTHKATLFGYVVDNNEFPILGAKVSLKDGAGIAKELIDTEYSDNNGFFSFSNLPHGIYLLELKHDNYDFSQGNRTVELQYKNLEVTLQGIGNKALMMTVNRVTQVGTQETITWDGRNIVDGSAINIKLYRNNAWETLASNLEFSEQNFKWKVTGPGDVNGVIKLELASEPSVSIESEVIVLAEPQPTDTEKPQTPIDTEESSGGGGCAINSQAAFDPTLIFLILGSLGYIVYRRRRKCRVA